jgi:GNAT superfamily N-acetyltransferase
MLRPTPFDEAFLGVACYHLMPPIEPSDLAALSAARTKGPFFASAKIDASDVQTVNTMGEFGFRRICMQVVLHHRLDDVPGIAADVQIAERLDLDPTDVRVHAAQFETGRFRQDPLIRTDAAIELYAAWVRISTRGAKRIASINRNFVSFEDREGVRWIDLVSVLDKRRGIATRLLGTIIDDARRKSLEEVKVVTDADNIAALHAYRAAGFQPERSLVVLHLHSGCPEDRSDPMHAANS